MKSLIVAKVGGSLFDLPDLRHRLDRWIKSVNPCRILLVPGGGQVVEAIRALHLVHQLTEEQSHWLAIRGMSVNAHFLSDLLGWPTQTNPREVITNAVLDPLPFFVADDQEARRLPHSWEITSDSLAFRVAEIAQAKYVLLKSAPSPRVPDWKLLAEQGFIDPYFPTLVFNRNVDVELVNLRDFE